MVLWRRLEGTLYIYLYRQQYLICRLMLHHVLPLNSAGKQESLAARLLLASIEIFFPPAPVRCAYVCYSRSQYWWSSISRTRCFRDPPWEKAKQNKTTENKTQTTSYQKVSQMLFSFFSLHTSTSHTRQTHTLIWACSSPPCSTAEAPHCTRTP